MKPTSSPKEILATAKTEDLEEDLVEQEEDEETVDLKICREARPRCTQRWAPVELQGLSTGEVPAAKTRERSAKQALVAKLLCRWWYVLPDWPPKDFDYTAALAEAGFRAVSVEEFEQEAELEGNLRKVFALPNGYPGLYRDEQGCLIDVRPVKGRPSYDQLITRSKSELHKLLVLAYTRQLEVLESRARSNDLETLRQQLRQELAQAKNNDMLNRYQAKEEACNFLLKCEKFFADYVGMKYALALNSGGIAISLGLEGIKRVIFPEDDVDQIRVYSNAFTFNARYDPHLELVHSDLQDLESKRFAPGKMILVLSYMRGRVPDMHKVMDICKKYEVQLLEDSAHGYGCSFDGQKCGSFGVVSTISTQANKLVNTGEGGMILTSNDAMQAFFIFSAGSYEELWKKHESMTPPEEVALKFKYTTVNKSVRMTNIQGAIMFPQLSVMDERIDQHNAMYSVLMSTTIEKLEALKPGSSRRVYFIPQVHELVGPVFDSMQMQIRDSNGEVAAEEHPGLNGFLKEMQGRKHGIAKFSDPANARNFLSWQYLKPEDVLADALPKTTKNLLNVCDLRLLCHDTEVEISKLANDLAECIVTHF
eukprot:g9543.t1